MDPVPVIAKLLTLLTLGTDVSLVAWWVFSAVSIVSRPTSAVRGALVRRLKPNARLIAFSVALTAMLGSLFYSEVAKYTPCVLCWYQRIAMYPQVFIIGLSILKRDRHGADYSIGLSVIGAALAAYHYYIQRGGPTFLPCSAIGYSASCSQRFTTEYGYITIPMMALSAFLAIITLMLIHKRTNG